MAFLKKFNIKKNCVGNHQAMNILSNFDSRKTEYREIIGSSVQDFGSFYQKPLEPIFTKDARQPLWLGRSLRHFLDKVTWWHFQSTSKEVIWPKKILNYMHGLKSAILAIFQKGLGWPCPVSAALKNAS